MHLYQTKIITIFKAKHYPKLLFTLLKLGADPFETKQTPKGSITLTYSLIKSKSIKKETRFHVLNFLAKKNWIRVDENGAVFSYCATHRSSCLKYLIQGDPGIENGA